MNSSIRNNTYVVRIKAVNGLLFLTYDYSITTNTDGDFLLSKGITHELSILSGNNNEQARSRIGDLEDTSVKLKQIVIKNSPTPDLLSSLNEISKWIENALSPSPSKQQQQYQQQQETNQVLIRAENDHESILAHAILIGFLMRYLRITFSMGLRLAHDSIPSITIDNSMERQLRIWEFCRYNIYQIDPQSRVSSPKPSAIEQWMPGSFPLSPLATGSAVLSNLDDKDVWGAGFHSGSSSGGGLHKPAYLAWRKECDALMAVERSKALSKMAALTAQKRGMVDNDVQAQDKSMKDHDGDNGPQGCAKDLLYRPRPSSKEAQAQWANVDEMEQSWNEKLLTGAVLA